MHAAPDSSSCRYQHAVAGYCLAFMESLTTMTPGSSLTLCDACAAANNPDWLGSGSTVSWVVATVLRLTANLTATGGRA